MVKALVGLCLHWGWLEDAIAIWLGFHCFLRVAEIVSALWGHFNLKVDASGGELTLPNTKASHRQQKVEGVTIEDKNLLSVLVWKLKLLPMGWSWSSLLY